MIRKRKDTVEAVPFQSYELRAINPIQSGFHTGLDISHVFLKIFWALKQRGHFMLMQVFCFSKFRSGKQAPTLLCQLDQLPIPAVHSSDMFQAADNCFTAVHDFFRLSECRFTDRLKCLLFDDFRCQCPCNRIIQTVCMQDTGCNRNAAPLESAVNRDARTTAANDKNFRFSLSAS